jgi:transcriptional regulator with XRE-family HTH domain
MTGKDVCKRIREIRLALKLSQAEFAERVGASVDSIGKIERGANIPTIDSLYRFADRLQIPVEQIISSPERGKHGNKAFKALSSLNDYLSTRSPEDVELIHDLAVRIFEPRCKR